MIFFVNAGIITEKATIEMDFFVRDKDYLIPVKVKAMVVSIFSMCVFRIGFSLILCVNMG